MITYIETSPEIKTDSEKDRYLSSLLKIYAFLNMEQKTQFLVSFCHEISASFKEFIANFLSISKEKTNLLTKKLCVLDIIIEEASGYNSIGALGLKDVINKKIDEQEKLNKFEESIKEIFNSYSDSDKSMLSESSNTSDKVEELRKMFDSILIKPVDIKEIISQISLFEEVYNIMHYDPITLPFFLLRVSELDQVQNKLNANMVLHLSNILRYQLEQDKGIVTIITQLDNIKTLPLNALLANLDNNNMNEEENFLSTHQNAYREILLIAIECKILNSNQQMNDVKPKKGGVKFEIIMDKENTQMIMDQDADDENTNKGKKLHQTCAYFIKLSILQIYSFILIEKNEEEKLSKPKLDDYEIDFSFTLD